MTTVVQSSSPYLTVSNLPGYDQSYLPYSLMWPPVNNIGAVHYDPGSRSMKIWDGMIYREIAPSYATVMMTGTAEAALEWATRKMLEEKVNMSLAEKHPAVKQIMDEITEKTAQLNTIKTLLE